MTGTQALPRGNPFSWASGRSVESVKSAGFLLAACWRISTGWTAADKLVGASHVDLRREELVVRS